MNISGDWLALGAVAALAAASVARRGSRAWTGADPYQAGDVLLDPHGLGSTGYNTKIDYLGFIAWLTPSEFLGLNPAVANPHRLEQVVRQAERGVAPPFLVVDLLDEGPPAAFRVVSHEARHRVHALRTDDPIPVGVIVRGGYDRARYIEPQWLPGATLLPDRRAPKRGWRHADPSVDVDYGEAVQISRYTHHGETHDVVLYQENPVATKLRESL